MKEYQMKLIGKIFIKGQIVVKTGLRIGAGKNDYDLGSPELSVVKTHGVPFIPGSSLKGKLRSMLAKYYGSWEIKEDKPIVNQIFGGDQTNTNNVYHSRLLVRDAHLVIDKNNDKDGVYTESKTENTIQRITGMAKNPREIERVPEGSKFNFECVYSMYDNDEDNKEASQLIIEHLKHLRLAFQLLEDDYLGGSGSRGYGQIEFKFDGKHPKVRKIDSENQIYHPEQDYTAIDFNWH